MRWKAGIRPVEAQLLAFGLQPAALLDATRNGKMRFFTRKREETIRISKLLAVMPAATVEGKVTLAAVHILEPFPPAQKDQQLHVPMRVRKMNRVISKKHIWKILNVRLVRLALWNLRGTLCHKRHRWLAGQVSELAVPVHLSAGDRSMSSTFRDFLFGSHQYQTLTGMKAKFLDRTLELEGKLLFWSGLVTVSQLTCHPWTSQCICPKANPTNFAPRTPFPKILSSKCHPSEPHQQLALIFGNDDLAIESRCANESNAFPQGFPTAAARCVGSRSKIHARRECHFLSAGKAHKKKTREVPVLWPYDHDTKVERDWRWLKHHRVHHRNFSKTNGHTRSNEVTNFCDTVGRGDRGSYV